MGTLAYSAVGDCSNSDLTPL